MNKVWDTFVMDLSDSLYSFKIVLLGDNFVGKSSIVLRFRDGLFPHSTQATIGMNYSVHYLEVESGVRLKLELFDSGGHISFWPSTRCFLPMADGIILVFDLGDKDSFQHAEYLYEDMCRMDNLNTVLFMLVGHKCDQNKREVDRDQAEMLASKLRAPYLEVSAKTGYNVLEIFKVLTWRIYQGLLSG